MVVEPFKSLLLGLFFLSVGMQTDLRALLAEPLLLPLSVVGLFAIKAVTMALVLRAGRFGWGHAAEGGLMMGQGGEFAFIVTGYATAGKLFEPALSQFLLLVVGLSMFATPLMARAGRSLRERWEHHHRDPEAPLDGAQAEPMEGHVIIVGFGRMGQLLAEVLTAQSVRFVAIDIDMVRSTTRHPLGEPVYYGDVSRPELLHRVHASKAAAIVLTMDHAEAALHATQSIRREFAGIPLLARAHDEGHARNLREAGANLAMPEALEAGLQLSAMVLKAIGMAEENASDAIRRERDSRLTRAEQKPMR